MGFPLSFFESTDVKRLQDIDRSLNSILRNQTICKGSITSTAHAKRLRRTIEIYKYYRRYMKSRHPNSEVFAKEWADPLRLYLKLHRCSSLLDFYFLCLIDYYLGPRYEFDFFSWELFERTQSLFPTDYKWAVVLDVFGKWSTFLEKFRSHMIEKYNNDIPVTFNDYRFFELKNFILNHVYCCGHLSRASTIKSDIQEICTLHIDRCRDEIGKEKDKLAQIQFYCVETRQLDQEYVRRETEEYRKDLIIFQDLLDFSHGYQYSIAE